MPTLGPSNAGLSHKLKGMIRQNHMKLQNLRSIDISTLTAGGGLADHVTRMNQLDQTANNNNNSILSNTVLSNYLQRQAIKHGNFYQAGISQHNAVGNTSAAIAND